MRVPNRTRGTHQQPPDESTSTPGGAAPGNEDQPYFEVTSGRVAAPYSKMPLWIMFASSVKARAVYEALYAYRDYWASGTRVERVPRSVLAELIGVKKDDSVDPYIRELEKVGAIDVIRNRTPDGMNAMNVYIIHTEPPADFTGPRTIDEYEQMRKMKDVSAAQPVPRSSGVRSNQDKSGNVAQQDSDNPDEKAVRAGRTVPRSSGVRTPLERGQVPRSSGVIRRSTSKNTPPSPPSRHTGDTSGDVVPLPREGEEISEETSTLVAEVRALRPEWAPSAIRRALAHPEVVERDNPALIRAAMLLVAKDPASTSPGRLSHSGPWWSRAADSLLLRNPASAYGPRCDDPQHDPDDPNSRLLLNPETLTARKCPACHPDLAPASGRDQR
ncbi:hypothetical protein [Streptosporangium sp. NPDC051022]|uniref:hypothetical protein n=1 Tax=Streptosporangium sp. NPDC051022 TaxID=3155752 RepID=UPI003422680A